MVAPNIAPVTAYTSRGKTRVYWCEDFINYKAPTRAELNAGVDLSTIFNDYDGFSVKSSQIDVVVLSTRTTGTIAGEKKPDDAMIKLLMSEDGEDARILMPEDAQGFIVWLHGGDKPGNIMDVWPVGVSAQVPKPSIKGNEPDTCDFQFACPREPARNITIPAAA